jgi:pimeloyl-ACP methyl ester carboxylesterase
MKRLIILLFVTSLLIVSGCSPYGNLSIMEFDQLNYPYPVKKAVLSDSMTIAYVDQGAGNQTIIFVHGLGSYLPAWKKNIEGLKQNYRCIAIDLPGYGKSSKAIHSGTMDFYADVIKTFMDKLDLKKAVIAGHSMGGQIAIVMALKYPEYVEKLILVSPAGIETFNEGQKEWFRNVMTVAGVKNTSVQQIRANLTANFYNLPEDAEFMITDRIAMRDAKYFDNYCYTVVKSVSGMVDQPVYDFLPNIKQKTLILFGENDNLIPNPYLNPGFTADIGKIANERIPNSKLVIVPSCGHFVQFEKYDVFNNAVKDFLK